MNELRHLILLEEPTIVHLKEPDDVINQLTKLQTQQKLHAFSHYLVANKSLIHFISFISKETIFGNFISRENIFGNLIVRKYIDFSFVGTKPKKFRKLTFFYL